MSKSATSAASDSVRPSNANLPAQYRPPQPGEGRQTEDRRHIDDVAAAACPHLWERGAEYVPDSEDLDVEHLAGLGVGHFLDRGEEAVARVVDDHVDAAEVFPGGRNRGLDVGLVRERDLKREKAARVDIGKSVGQPTGGASGGRDVVAALQQLRDQLQTEAARGAGDEPGCRTIGGGSS